MAQFQGQYQMYAIHCMSINSNERCDNIVESVMLQRALQTTVSPSLLH